MFWHALIFVCGLVLGIGLVDRENYTARTAAQTKINYHRPDVFYCDSGDGHHEYQQYSVWSNQPKLHETHYRNEVICDPSDGVCRPVEGGQLWEEVKR